MVLNENILDAGDGGVTVVWNGLRCNQSVTLKSQFNSDLDSVLV